MGQQMTYHQRKFGAFGYSRHSKEKKRRDRFYGGVAWRRLRAYALQTNPLCHDPFGEHEAIGRPVGATDVDHVIPRRLRPDLELDSDNLQTLCASCHARKSAFEKYSQ